MILIVTYPNNEHVDEVLQHLTRPTVVVDTGSFPVSLGLNASFTREKEFIHIVPPGSEKSVCLCDIGAVWYRRISPLEVNPELTDPTARLFAWSEANEALLGVWYSLNCFWMNPPTADEVSQRKIRQLQVARKIGLSIPDTLITNDPIAAREFIERHGVGNVVRKCFRNIQEAPRETHLLRHEDLALLDSVRYTPVIFQEYVPANLDLRITIIEDEIFPAAISSEQKYDADYRPGLRTATVKPFTLPPRIAEQLLELMKEFGIKYGAIDMRITPDGDFIFFEVNPAGEYLFISRRTNQPVSAAIAASLERHDRARFG